MNFMISLMDTAFLPYKAPRPSNLRSHHQRETKISQRRVISDQIPEDKMGTARSTHEDEKFIWHVRRKISAKGPPGRRRCRWRDTHFQRENDERIWEAIIRHLNINIIKSLKLGLNLFSEVMKAQ